MLSERLNVCVPLKVVPDRLSHFLEADKVSIIGLYDIQDSVKALLYDLIEPDIVGQDFDYWFPLLVELSEIFHL